MDFWLHTKTWLIAATGLPDSTMHALFGMMLLMLGAALFRRAPWHWLPWSFVLGLELVNEAYDLFNPDSGEATLADCWSDLWITMFAPTLLLVLTPLLLRRVRR